MQSDKTAATLADLDVAIVSIGSLDICVPVQYIQIAITRPEKMSSMPRRAAALIGLVDYRGVSVPVADLSCWVEIPKDEQALKKNERILILKSGGRYIGLLVNAVKGSARIHRRSIQKMDHMASEEDVFEAVTKLPGEEVFTPLLEPERLMAVAHLWGGSQDADGLGDIEANSDEDEQLQRRQEAAAFSQYVLLRTGSMQLGIPALYIAQLLPRVPLQDLLHGKMQGILMWRERHVPVADIGATMGQGECAASPWLAVLTVGGLAMAISVDEMKGIVPVRTSAINAAPVAMKALGFVAGVAMDAAGEEIYLLDIPALLKYYPEASISEVGTALAVTKSAQVGNPNPVSYVVFDCGGLLCSSTEGLQEIISLKGVRTEAAEGSGRYLEWRSNLVEVLDVVDPLRKPNAQLPTPTHALIFKREEHFKAYLIHGVHSIVRVGQGLLTRLKLPGGISSEILMINDALNRQSVRTIDFSVEH